MALTRKFLKALGVSEEAIEEIITAHTETVSDLKDELKTVQAKAEKLDEVTKERDELQKKANDTTAAERIAELEKQVDGYKTSEMNAKKKTALSELLEKAGIDKRGFAKILTATDFSTVELDDAGAIKGSTRLSEKIKTDWADLLVTGEKDPAKPATPPRPETNKKDPFLEGFDEG